tara:strand:+ start:361 stop:612 length:252 start_codon:yes stop_codon:yes gene_type:complete
MHKIISNGNSPEWKKPITSGPYILTLNGEAVRQHRWVQYQGKWVQVLAAAQLGGILLSDLTTAHVALLGMRWENFSDFSTQDG